MKNEMKGTEEMKEGKEKKREDRVDKKENIKKDIEKRETQNRWKDK